MPGRNGEKQMIRIGCVADLVPRSTYLEKARVLKNLGYDGIAVYGDCETWTERDTEELMEIKNGLGFDISEFCLVGRWYGHLLEETLAEKNIETVCRAVDVCARAGAVTEIEFDAPRKSEISFQYNRYPEPPEELTARYVSNARRICDYAREKGVMILLEACNRYEREYNNTQKHSLKIVKAVGRDNMKLLCDLFHMSLDERDVAKTLLECGEYVGHIHLGDTNRRLPGQGMMQWERIFQALKNIGYSGYMNLECSVFGNPEEELAKTIRYLHGYLDS